MESMISWRDYKARQENERMRGEVRVSSRNDEISYMNIPMPRRVVVIARYRLGELEKRQSKGFQNDGQRENFECERDMWFSWLKDSMKTFRLSKEYLAENGLSWNDCKRMAYGA